MIFLFYCWITTTRKSLRWMKTGINSELFLLTISTIMTLCNSYIVREKFNSRWFLTLLLNHHNSNSYMIGIRWRRELNSNNLPLFYFLSCLNNMKYKIKTHLIIKYNIIDYTNNRCNIPLKVQGNVRVWECKYREFILQSTDKLRLHVTCRLLTHSCRADVDSCVDNLVDRRTRDLDRFGRPIDRLNEWVVKWQMDFNIDK